MDGSSWRSLVTTLGCLAVVLISVAIDARPASATRSMDAQPGGGRTQRPPTLSHADYFHNTNPVSGSFGDANTGQSVVTVSGMPPVVEDVNVYVWGLSVHQMSVASVWIESPEGRRVYLLGRACKPPTTGDQAEVLGENLTFDDEAETALAETAPDLTHSCWFQKGTVRPSVYGSSVPPRLSSFRGMQANGNWTLHVSSFSQSYGTSLVGGFSIGLTAGDFPETTILSGPRENDVTGKSVSFAFRSDAPNATFQCSLPPVTSDFVPCTSPFTATNLPYATSLFLVKAVTLAGPDPTPASVRWRVTAPGTFIDGGPATGDRVAGPVTLSFSSNLSAATFECSLDGNSFGPCGSPHTISSLSDGPHTLAVRAKTVDDLDATPAQRTWISVSPDTVAVSGPSNVTNRGPAVFSFLATLTGASFQCALDRAAFTPCSPPHRIDGLADGSHSLRVRASVGGSVDTTPLVYTWINVEDSREVKSAKIRLEEAIWRRHKIKVRVRALAAASGRVHVMAKARVGNRFFTISKVATLRAGRAFVALKLRGNATRAQRAKLTVRYAGDDVHAPQQVVGIVRKVR